jgi:hypothetical protein
VTVEQLIEQLMAYPLDSYVSIVYDRQEPDDGLVEHDPVVMLDHGGVVITAEHLIDWIKADGLG